MFLRGDFQYMRLLLDMIVRRRRAFFMCRKLLTTFSLPLSAFSHQFIYTLQIAVSIYIYIYILECAFAQIITAHMLLILLHVFLYLCILSIFGSSKWRMRRGAMMKFCDTCQHSKPVHLVWLYQYKTDYKVAQIASACLMRCSTGYCLSKFL